MLTPQEIQDQKFEKVVFGGYDMSQVDQCLDDILVDYTALYKENAALKAKMRVLVDKIEEYRSVDEQMRKALFTAQVTAKDIVDKARAEADVVLKNAHADARRSTAELQRGVSAEESRLMAAKAVCGEYAQKIRTLLQKNIEVIETIMDRPAEEYMNEPRRQEPVPEPAPVVSAPEPERRAVPEQPPMQEGARFFEVSPGDQNLPQEPDDLDDTAKIYGGCTFTPKPRFNFSDLRFGKDYNTAEDSDNK